MSEWYSGDNKLDVCDKRSLQESLSVLLNDIYYKSPRVHNELINRDKPSAQANAARNKLVLAMYNNESEADLGIDKFPPEKSIYRAVLRATSLHVKGRDGTWRFQGPTKGDDPCNMLPVWSRIDEFFDTTERQPRSLIELNQELMSPPYGIKEGLLPILYISTILANQEQLAVFEGHVYTPQLTEEQIERFLKRPDEFTVQRFRITGLNQSIHKAYSETLYSDGRARTILELVKPIAKMVLSLPHYTLTTTEESRLSKRAQKVRDAFKLSKSPLKLMMEELPYALGIDIGNASNEKAELEQFSQNLIDTLRELKYCFPNMKDELKGLLAQAFMLDKDIELPQLREAVAGRCRGLEDYTIDKEGLKAFIQRALGSSQDADTWLNEVLSFLGQKPAEKWTEADRDSAEYRLTIYTHKLDELERLRLHYKDMVSEHGEEFDVYLLRSVKRGAPDYDEVITVDKRRHEAIKSIKKDLLTVLSQTDDALRMAVIAEIVDEILSVRNKAKDTINRKADTTSLKRAK
ncbi:MAG: hypothetical protein IBX64_08595 [Actinobacteria bacterium]|nr:hypothetical protein [Actinomycetota bacterium]